MYDDSSRRPKFVFTQTRTGAAALKAFEGPLFTGEVFSIVSKREASDPLGIVVKKDGIFFERFSVCCEYKYKYGSKLGGTSGAFKLVCVAGGSRCATCFVGKVTREQKKRGKKKADVEYTRRLSGGSSSSYADDFASSDSTLTREEDSDGSAAYTSPVPNEQTDAKSHVVEREANSIDKRGGRAQDSAVTKASITKPPTTKMPTNRRQPPAKLFTSFDLLRERLEKREAEMQNKAGLRLVDVDDIVKEFPDCQVIVDPRTLISPEQIKRVNDLKNEADAEREKALEDARAKAAEAKDAVVAKRRQEAKGRSGQLSALRAKARHTKAEDERKHRASVDDIESQIATSKVESENKRRSSLLELQAQVAAEISKLTTDTTNTTHPTEIDSTATTSDDTTATSNTTTISTPATEPDSLRVIESPAVQAQLGASDTVNTAKASTAKQPPAADASESTDTQLAAKAKEEHATSNSEAAAGVDGATVTSSERQEQSVADVTKPTGKSEVAGASTADLITKPPIAGSDAAATSAEESEDDGPPPLATLELRAATANEDATIVETASAEAHIHSSATASAEDTAVVETVHAVDEGAQATAAVPDSASTDLATPMHVTIESDNVSVASMPSVSLDSTAEGQDAIGQLSSEWTPTAEAPAPSVAGDSSPTIRRVDSGKLRHTQKPPLTPPMQSIGEAAEGDKPNGEAAELTAVQESEEVSAAPSAETASTAASGETLLDVPAATVTTDAGGGADSDANIPHDDSQLVPKESLPASPGDLATGALVSRRVSFSDFLKGPTPSSNRPHPDWKWGKEDDSATEASEASEPVAADDGVVRRVQPMLKGHASVSSIVGGDEQGDVDLDKFFDESSDEELGLDGENDHASASNTASDFQEDNTYSTNPVNPAPANFQEDGTYSTNPAPPHIDVSTFLPALKSFVPNDASDVESEAGDSDDDGPPPLAPRSDVQHLDPSSAGNAEPGYDGQQDGYDLTDQDDQQGEYAEDDQYVDDNQQEMYSPGDAELELDAEGNSALDQSEYTEDQSEYGNNTEIINGYTEDGELQGEYYDGQQQEGEYYDDGQQQPGEYYDGQQQPGEYAQDQQYDDNQQGQAEHYDGQQLGEYAPDQPAYDGQEQHGEHAQDPQYYDDQQQGQVEYYNGQEQQGEYAQDPQYYDDQQQVQVEYYGGQQQPGEYAPDPPAYDGQEQQGQGEYTQDQQYYDGQQQPGEYYDGQQQGEYAQDPQYYDDQQQGQVEYYDDQQLGEYAPDQPAYDGQEQHGEYAPDQQYYDGQQQPGEYYDGQHQQGDHVSQQYASNEPPATVDTGSAAADDESDEDGPPPLTRR